VNIGIEYKKNSGGFSFVEIIIVISILIVFIVASDLAFRNFNSKSNLEIATNSVVQTIRQAQSNSEKGKEDSGWGVFVSDGLIIIFSGDSYAGRDNGFDQRISLPSGVTASGLGEIVFTKIFGNTNDTGTIVLSQVNQEAKNIIINEKGVVSY